MTNKLAKEKAAIEKKAEKEAKAIRAKESKAKAAKVKKEDSDSEDVKPKNKRKSNGTASAKKTNGVKKVESGSDSDAPLMKKPAKKTNGKVSFSDTQKSGITRYGHAR